VVEVSISLVEHAEWMKVAAGEVTVCGAVRWGEGLGLDVGLGELWLDWEDQENVCGWWHILLPRCRLKQNTVNAIFSDGLFSQLICHMLTIRCNSSAANLSLKLRTLHLIFWPLHLGHFPVPCATSSFGSWLWS
jgi:chemotaxis receptor (MCP) glutamine deamidase CheD